MQPVNNKTNCIGLSPLAMQVDRRTSAIRTRIVWGVCLHTTGSGVTVNARRWNKRPIDVALKWYKESQNGANGYPWGGPHYVIDHNGGIWQIADENILTNHCGGPWRQVYLSGKWVERCSPRAVAEWHRRWTDYRSPQDLFPSKSPNTDYIGIEMIPCGNGFGVPQQTPWADVSKFTNEQYTAVARLLTDIGTRQHLPDGWHKGPQLVGHEDVQLIDRHDKLGGWDPGNLRDRPYFDMNMVRRLVGA